MVFVLRPRAVDNVVDDPVFFRLSGSHNEVALDVALGPRLLPAQVAELGLGRDQCVAGLVRADGELLKLRIEVAQSTVAKYMVKRPRRPGQFPARLAR